MLFGHFLASVNLEGICKPFLLELEFLEFNLNNRKPNFKILILSMSEIINKITNNWENMQTIYAVSGISRSFFDVGEQ